jgi:hypothetical protein
MRAWLKSEVSQRTSPPDGYGESLVASLPERFLQATSFAGIVHITIALQFAVELRKHRTGQPIAALHG